MNTFTTTYDVAVVGAGSAGLQAALTLGRMRRRVVVLGTDRYRNDPAEHMQNFIAHDGTPPAELREAARRDVERYDTVTFLERAVASVTGESEAFVLDVDGLGPISARRVVLATGLTDTLPDVPGLAPLFGDLVAHCPFCHGYELAGRPIGILGAGAHVPGVAAMISTLATSITVLTDGAELDGTSRSALKRIGAEVHDEKVLGVGRGPLGVTVDLDGAPPVALGGMFVAPTWAQSAPLPEQLGLETSPLGGVLIDAMGATSRTGVYAAGDMAHTRDLPMPMASVLTAAAAGLVAGAACHRDLAVTDAGLTPA